MAAAAAEVVLGVMGKRVVELLMGLAQLWAALLVGVLVGWLWKPAWAAKRLGQSAVAAAPEDLAPSAPGTAISDAAVLGTAEKSSLELERLSMVEGEKLVVKLEDLEYLSQLVEVKDGGSPWIPMMDRSNPTMTYQAWRRDPETGPPQYRTRTVFEDATPELVRDFFWDDEFRSKWDDMLIHTSTLEECPTTGTMIVQWVRKFPFFCSDREYIIGRRIWEAGRSYYCVTKGVQYDSIPRRKKPRRVDLYYSSWCIRAVESNRGDGQLTACEVLLFHYEDMGIPWEIAKLGVRQGMWGTVKKIDPGLRAYQMTRRAGDLPSRCASMAQINSKIDLDFLLAKETAAGDNLSEEGSGKSQEKQWGKNIPKLLVVGGAVALACSLDHGLLTKAVIFGVARRFGMLGKKL